MNGNYNIDPDTEEVQFEYLNHTLGQWFSTGVKLPNLGNLDFRKNNLPYLGN